jgi:hypothetical protein
VHPTCSASDKVYQLIAHGRWFSPGNPASSTTKAGRHDIAEILLKVALSTINQIKSKVFLLTNINLSIRTDTCLFKKMYAPSSSLLQGKHLPFTPSPLRLNIFRLFVILSLTQLFLYTPEIFLFSTATSKYKYRAPLRRIGQEYSAKVAFSIFQSLNRIQSLPVRSKLI